MVLTRNSNAKDKIIDNKKEDTLVELTTVIKYEDWIKQGKPDLSDWSKIIF